jgi:hypothetical protein
MVMAPLDHVDGVDLDITELLDRGERGRGTAAKRRVCIQPLGA